MNNMNNMIDVPNLIVWVWTVQGYYIWITNEETGRGTYSRAVGYTGYSTNPVII